MPGVSVPSPSTAFARWKFVWVLGLFTAYPVGLLTLPPGGVRYAAIDVVAMAMYIATWCPLRRARRVVLLATALGGAVLLIVAWTTTGTAVFAGSRPWAFTRSLLLLLFFVAITLAVLASVLTRTRVTLDTVLGAICVYLLLGALWGVLYNLAALHRADAFRVTTDPQNPSGRGSSAAGLSLPDSLYFSYVTLTTVGFGDITPTTVAARTLAWIEAGSGQIYLAVLIARLVSLQIVHADPNTPARAAPRRNRMARRRQHAALRKAGRRYRRRH